MLILSCQRNARMIVGCMVTMLDIHLQQNKDVSEDDTCNIEYEIIVKEN